MQIKNKKIIILVFLIILVTIIVLSLILSKNKTINEYAGGKDLTTIKQTMKPNKDYYLFEDNNKKYVFFITEVSCYSPDNIEIKSIDIKSKEYNEENKLIIEMDINTKTIKGTTPDGMIIDGSDKDSRDIILEVDKNFKGLIVNGTEYTKYSGGIIYNNQTNKYGYVDSIGNIVLPIEYKKIEHFDEDYLLIHNNAGKGIADRTGKILVECKYGSILKYGENTFKVSTNELHNSSYYTGSYTKIGIIDINGNLLKGFFEIENGPQVNEYYIYRENNKHGILDNDLNIIVESKYDYINIEKSKSTKEYYIIVWKDEDKGAVIDFKGNIIIPFQSNMTVVELKKQYEEHIK